MLIDLTHPLRDGQPVYPGDPELRLVPHASISVEGYNVTRIEMGTHQGTHLDAPFHFLDGGETVDSIPLDRLFGPASLLDLSQPNPPGPGAEIDTTAFRVHADLFAPGARILIYTGWERLFGTPAFFGSYPVLTEEAAVWIASRRIGLLGIDTPSVGGEECHRVLLGAGMVLVETLANLNRLPRQFTFIGFPLRLVGRDGSPIHTATLLPDAR